MDNIEFELENIFPKETLKKKGSRHTGDISLDCHQSYFDLMSDIPVSSHESVVELFKRFKNGDMIAREEIIKSNIRLVFSIAYQYRRVPDISFEDLIQEGNIGLIKSVEKFDWSKGHRFSTYAMWWIKQSISQFVMNRRIVRVPAHVKSIKNKMMKAIESYKTTFGMMPDFSELSDLVGSSHDVVRAAYETTFPIVSLQTKINSKFQDSSSKELEEVIADDNENMDPFENLSKKETADQIRNAISQLTQKELIILKLRFGNQFEIESEDDYIMDEEEINSIEHGTVK
jgi:RNA polymerase primary sigma factor